MSSNEYAGYALQIQVNAGMASAYWNFDYDFQDIHPDLDGAEADLELATEDGFPRENLRIVGLTVVVPPKEAGR